MAVGGSVEEFDIWLKEKLLEFNTDEGVFGSYIRGILEGEETADEKMEALGSILAEISSGDITMLCQELFEKWDFFFTKSQSSRAVTSEDVDVKLAKLMESQAKATTVRNSNYTDEERRIREAILLQYGQCSDDEAEGDGGPVPKLGPPKNTVDLTKEGLQKNTNATAVAQAEREKRERSKEESAKKKEKDKEDREKQKQTQQDKKEKRKTQKGERRR